MSHRLAPWAPLLFILAVPQVALAQDGRIMPVLSTTMQRGCQVETTRTPRVTNGQVQAAPPVERSTQDLYALRSAGDWRLTTTAQWPQGHYALRFDVSADGARVTNAHYSGPTIGGGPATPQEARVKADDVPERLLVGRAFAVGDRLYPEGFGQDLLDRIAGQSDRRLPDFTTSFDVRYVGEVRHEGRRAWHFVGDVTLQTGFERDGQAVRIDNVTSVDVLHDVETGLLLTSTNRDVSRGWVDGQLRTEQGKTNPDHLPDRPTVIRCLAPHYRWLAITDRAV